MVFWHVFVRPPSVAFKAKLGNFKIIRAAKTKRKPT